MMSAKPEMSFQVIGAGFGRTGTSSLKKALEILWFPCYTMVEVFIYKDRGHPDFWLRATNGKPVDFNEIY